MLCQIINQIIIIIANDINNVGVQIFLVSKLSIETSLIFVCFVSDYGNKSETKKK